VVPVCGMGDSVAECPGGVNTPTSSLRPALKAGQQVHVMASKSGSTLTAQTVIIGAMPAPTSDTPPGQ
jgi:hypothetical protein